MLTSVEGAQFATSFDGLLATFFIGFHSPLQPAPSRYK